MLQLYRNANPYHLVEPSPWPIITSFSLLVLTITSAIYFHGYANVNILIISFIIVLIPIILWFRDITAEGTYHGNHTFIVQKGLILGFILFVVSEIIVFFGVFWAYFHSALAPTVELGAIWPPLGIDALSPFEIPLLNTVLLLSTGATITYAHHALINGNRRATINGLILTIVLAIVFTALQSFEYWNAPFTISDSVYGTIFYAATGAHGLHVIIGTLLILASTIRVVNYHVTNIHHLGFETSAIYAHFVDIVWVILYLTMYWWGS